MSNTTIAIAIFLFYWIVVSYLKKRGTLAKYNIDAYGPILMIRTERGQGLLKSLARPKRFWRLFANIGIPLMFAGMVAMFLVVILSDIAMLTSFGGQTPEPGKFNEPQNIFLIPGVNEFIPLTWGIIALVVTLIVHEFSHAILSIVENVRVKSMGILLALVPIGGFAEPDEEQLFGVSRNENGDGESSIDEKSDEKKEAATTNQRSRILAAGVMSNFVVAFIAFLLFFGPVLGGIGSVSDAMITDVNSESPVTKAGINENMVITQINDTQTRNANDVINYMMNVSPGSTVEIHAVKDGTTSTYEVDIQDKEREQVQGIYISDVVEESPAENSGLEKGMLIVGIDNNSVQSINGFSKYMENTSPGQEVEIKALKPNQTDASPEQFNLTLTTSPDGTQDKGFIGIFYERRNLESNSLGIEIGNFPATRYLEMLKNIPSRLDELGGWIIIFGLPIVGFGGEGFRGFSGTFAQFFEPIGWAEPLGIGIFWMANALLWIAWLNFYVGLFNCLPAVPLDGGHVFRGYLQSFAQRITGSEGSAEKVAGAVTMVLTLVILMSFAIMIFGPYIVHGF
ncbi:site-2 protease family protein [Methanohalobium sp.]|uniref:site-2 protease family protein n=1 Tax=Methanohalobium sp. TaxID=2837493 RepID=UPI0025D981D6|nr:site-2 protease family protein [Methanohalobium sp.]